ncbi:hypothetical protein WR25_20097 [Diploscapter pachys]|uniref:Uncharacterized protein n=1 Tax=Diploscapter pachys TaxID=2018661 RepID=A0A2A2L1U0_9BILA|nr:hypothetical protein WR25_20097 [Diploscapter pachys]
MKLLFKRTQDELGTGPCQIRWKSTGTALAVAGSNRAVILYDRKGEIIDALDMSGKIIAVEWDKEGDVLAILMTGTTMLTLWDINSRDTDQIDTGTGARFRKVSLLGKHQKSITDVKFTKDDKIITLADDNNIIISNLEGDSLFTSHVGHEPSHMKIGEVKKQGNNTETVISCVLARSILMLTRMSELETPVNLQFQERYGHIVDYQWFNDGYITLGFDRGFIICISAHQTELGSELYSISDYKTYFGGVSVSQTFGKIFSVGDHQIKVREMSDMQDLFAMIEVDTDKDLCAVNCSEDGQMVAVSSESGSLYVYLTKMPTMAAAHNDIIAVLSTLNQITVMPEADKQKQIAIDIEVEPTLIGVGPRHVAAVMNNRIWYYEYHSLNHYIPGASSDVPTAVSKSDYLSTVLGVKLNYEYAAVIMEGKLRLHKTNYIVYFSIEEWAVVSEYRHTSPIRQLFPDPDGIRSGLFDERLDSWIYSPVDDSMYKLPSVGSAVHYKGGLWETFTIDRDTFVVFDSHSIYVFLLAKGQIEKEQIMYIGSTKLPFGNTPLMLSKGIIYCQTNSGKPNGILLESHRTDTILEGKSHDIIQSLLDQALKLRRWAYAWRICEFTKNLAHWNLFAQAALVNTNVELGGDEIDYFLKVLTQIDKLQAGFFSSLIYKTRQFRNKK